jgi:hypothetical protein
MAEVETKRRTRSWIFWNGMAVEVGVVGVKKLVPKLKQTINVSLSVSGRKLRLS